MNKISIITINFNSSEDTLKMVESVIKTTTSEFEIIIVDNCSNYDDFQKLSVLNNTQNIKIVRSRLNLGFSGGNMLGMQHISEDSKFYLFLNNDTVLKNDILTILLEDLKSTPESGLISAQQFDEHNNVVSSFNTFPNLPEKLLGKKLAKLLFSREAYNRRKTYKETIDAEVVSGAVMLFKRECFERIGGFDTGFFLYCEEEDISKRVWNSGYKVSFSPRAQITHYCGKSTKRSFEIEREFLISYFKLLNKHFSLLPRSVFKILFFIRYLKKTLRDSKNLPFLLLVLDSNKDKKSLKHIQKISQI